MITISMSTSIAYGQSPEWSEPVRLSPLGILSWFPEITTDRAGGVHAFWAAGRPASKNGIGAYDTVVYCQPTLQGCNDIVEVAALAGGGYNTRPSAIVDAQGIVHMLWHGPNITYYTFAPVLQAASGQNWAVPRRLSGKEPAYYVNIAQDQRGVLHAVWSEIVPQNEALDCPGCSDIFYRQSTDWGRCWSRTVDLSNTELGSQNPSITFGMNGTIYVTWQEGQDFLKGKGKASTSMIAISRDSGLTWEHPTSFIFPNDTPYSITAGVDGQGNLLVVWRQVVKDGIFYQISNDQGRSWSMPKQLQGIVTRSIFSDLDSYDMVVDSAGHLHLVLVGQNAQTAAMAASQPGIKDSPNIVYYLEWNGTTWSEPTPLFVASKGELPEWPRIAISNGNQLHVVWFLRDKANIYNSERGKYEVWYIRGFALSPKIQPIAWPTPTPILLAATIPTVAPTPTTIPSPCPTLDPSLTQVSVPVGTITFIYSDNDEVVLLVKSLLPAALIIVVVIVTVRFWRQ